MGATATAAAAAVRGVAAGSLGLAGTAALVAGPAAGPAAGSAVEAAAVSQMRRRKILFFYYAIRLGGRTETKPFI